MKIVNPGQLKDFVPKTETGFMVGYKYPGIAYRRMLKQSNESLVITSEVAFGEPAALIEQTVNDRFAVALASNRLAHSEVRKVVKNRTDKQVSLFIVDISVSERLATEGRLFIGKSLISIKLATPFDQNQRRVVPKQEVFQAKLTNIPHGATE